MKIFRLLVFTTALAGLSACSDDDSSSNSNAAVAGTYNLTMVIAPEPVDFDKNTVSSLNLMMESPCYSGSKIILNDNGTFAANYSSVFFASDTGCITDQSSGTWAVEGDDLILTNTLLEPSSSTEYVLNDDTITLTMINASYPNRDEQGEPVYSTGTVTLTYTKE
jgi:hypothetical protein